MQKLKQTVVTALLAVMSMSVYAGSINLIENGSFEEDDVRRWTVFDSITGWDTLQGSGIEIQDNRIFTTDTIFGNQFVELDSHDLNGDAIDDPTNSFMVQDVSVTTGSYYELSFWYLPRTSTDGDNGIYAYWGDDITTIVSSSPVATADESTLTSSVWTEYTVILQATAETMYVGFSAFGLDNTLGGFIDNVSLVAVPEPATLGLLALGLAGLGASRRRARS